MNIHKEYLLRMGRVIFILDIVRYNIKDIPYYHHASPEENEKGYKETQTFSTFQQGIITGDEEKGGLYIPPQETEVQGPHVIDELIEKLMAIKSEVNAEWNKRMNPSKDSQT